MPSPVDHDGLWMKAKVHLNRSFSATDAGDFDQAALWAASGLELLGKAALAKVNPLLVADPVDDGHSLLVAAELTADASRFKSIPAKALFSRCARAFPPFNAKEAGLIASQRNEELHSALSPFAGIDEDHWWQRYWAQAVLLIHAQDRDVEDLVGSARESTVERFLERNSENIGRRVQAILERARRRWEQAANSKDGQDAIRKLVAQWSPWWDMQAPGSCPVCGNSGLLASTYVTESEVITDWEEGTAFEAVVAASEGFECEHCALRLFGQEYLAAAGLPDSFNTEREYEPPWDDYGND